MTRDEREHLRVKFAVAMANLQHCAVYWSPSHKTIFCRSIPFEERALFKAMRGRPPLPRDVQRVGIYQAPFCSSEFVHDLLDHIRRSALISA